MIKNEKNFILHLDVLLMKKLSVYVKKNSDATKNGRASPHIHTFQGELVYASAHKLGGVGGGGRGGPAAGKLQKIRATTTERKQFKNHSVGEIWKTRK